MNAEGRGRDTDPSTTELATGHLAQRIASAFPLTVFQTAKGWNYAKPYENALRKLISRHVI